MLPLHVSLTFTVKLFDGGLPLPASVSKPSPDVEGACKVQGDDIESVTGICSGLPMLLLVTLSVVVIVTEPL